MTETEWLAVTDPTPMLRFLRGKVSDRKLRLFAVACCHRLSHLFPFEECSKALEWAERYADSPPPPSRFWAVNSRLENLCEELPPLPIKQTAAVDALRWCFAVDHPPFARCAAEWSLDALALEGHPDGIAEPDYEVLRGAVRATVLPYQAALAHDIFGNPFRPVTFDPDWRTSTVVALANQTYESRDFAPMPVLADALQDAGCDHPDILTHCRDPQPAHVRGCWVVDLILGKS